MASFEIDQIKIKQFCQFISPLKLVNWILMLHNFNQVTLLQKRIADIVNCLLHFLYCWLVFIVFLCYNFCDAAISWQINIYESND